MHAWEIAAEAGIAAGVGRIAACCAAAKAETAEEALATCVLADSCDLDLARQAAFHQAPYSRMTCPEACRYLVDVAASDPGVAACVAGPWVWGPWCSEKETVDDTTGLP